MSPFRFRAPMARDHWQREIAALDPEADWATIYGITTGHEFPWDSLRATEIALMRTYAVPAIGELLARTGEFLERTEKRYDDTAIVLVEAGNYLGGETTDPTAFRRMNRMHGAYDIPNDQMLYVLSTFPVMARRWIDRHGYRPLSETEVEAMVRYWQRFGELMGLTDIPVDYQAFSDYLDAYEREHFGFSTGGRAVADATLNLIDTWYPAPVRRLVRSIALGFLDEPLRRALYLDAPPPIVNAALQAGLAVRKKVLAVLPARRDYVSPLDKLKLRTYPRGYDLATVGTFPS